MSSGMGGPILRFLGRSLTAVAFRPRTIPPVDGITQFEVGASLWNGAALPILGEPNSYWVAYRRRCTPTSRSHNVSTICICKAFLCGHGGGTRMEVGSPLCQLPVDDTLRCSTRTYSGLDWVGPEDPRLLLHDNNLLVVYNDLCMSDEKTLVRRMHIARFAGTSPDRLGGLTVSMLATPGMRRLEKNWIPLAPGPDGMLRFVYSITPHKVIEYEPHDLSQPVSVSTTHPGRMGCRFGVLRGGTNAVDWGQDKRGRKVLIAIAHITTSWKWYLSYAYTFLAEPPFTVLQATPPLKLTRERVEFPQSLFRDPRTQLLFLLWGEENRRTMALPLSDSVLRRLLDDL